MKATARNRYLTPEGLLITGYDDGRITTAFKPDKARRLDLLGKADASRRARAQKTLDEMEAQIDGALAQRRPDTGGWPARDNPEADPEC